MVNIRFLDLWNNEPAIMMQETTDLPVTAQLIDNAPVSGENNEFLQGNNGFYVAHSDVQRMINTATPRYEEISMRRLFFGMNRSVMRTLLKTTAKESSK